MDIPKTKDIGTNKNNTYPAIKILTWITSCIGLAINIMMLKMYYSLFDWHINRFVFINIFFIAILIFFMLCMASTSYSCRTTRIWSAVICTLFAILGFYILYKNMTLSITGIFSDQVAPMRYQIFRTVIFMSPIAIWFLGGRIHQSRTARLELSDNN